MDNTTDIRWSVGELARSTGLTVRTLHHWDEVGLLVPSERSGAGHRRYTVEDVRRLYRVVALRRLGLGLPDVAEVLEREGPALRPAVERHLVRLDAELARLHDLRERVQRLLAALDADGGGGPELLDAIEVMTMHENHYTDEQLEQLAARREALGEEGMLRAQRDWADVIDGMRREHAAGTDPADRRVQALAARWRGLIEAFTGGDPGIERSLNRMYEAESPETASSGMVDAEVMAYAQRALAAGQAS